MIGCIYKMKSPSGRVYIGQTRDLLRRFREYTNMKCKPQRKLYYSIKKYGFDAHDFHVIDFCPVSELNNRERHWQDVNDVCGNNGLNLVLTKSDEKTAYRSLETRLKTGLANIGKHNHDDRVKALISKAHKGKKIPLWHRKLTSELLKEKFKGRGNPFYGKKHSEELVAEIIRRSTGGNNGRSKKFLNIETGVYYETLSEFASHLVISNPTAIKRLKENYYPSYRQV